MENKPQLVAKEQEVEQLVDWFKGAQGVVLADYRGLNVSEITALRAELRKSGVIYKVAKNTLIKRAADELDLSVLDEYLNGPTGIAFAEDPVALAKILAAFIKEHKKLTIKAGLLEGQFLNAESIDSLAKIPPREQLLAKLLGSMQAPLYNLAGGMNGLLRSFVYALDQIAKSKEQQA